MEWITRIFESSKKKSLIEKRISKLYRLYTLETAVVFIIFFSGGHQFVLNNQLDIVYISIGFLTFISVFFSFVYSATLVKMKTEFSQMIDEHTKKIKNKINKELTTDEHREITEELEQIEDIRKKVSPEWNLFVAVILFLSTIAVSFLNPDNVMVNNIAELAMSIFFHAGMAFAYFLVTSLMAVTAIGKPSKK